MHSPPTRKRMSDEYASPLFFFIHNNNIFDDIFDDIVQFWCVGLHLIMHYLMIANYFWMFCEGLHLHLVLVVVSSAQRQKRTLVAFLFNILKYEMCVCLFILLGVHQGCRSDANIFANRLAGADTVGHRLRGDALQLHRGPDTVSDLFVTRTSD